MDLDDFIIAVSFVIDETIPQVTGCRGLRQRGLQPVLTDSAVLTMEVVGEYLGPEQEWMLFACF